MRKPKKQWIIAAISFAILTGCGATEKINKAVEESVPVEATTEPEITLEQKVEDLGDSWENLAVLINGKKYQMPFGPNELTEVGLKFDTRYNSEEDIVGAGGHDIIFYRSEDMRDYISLDAMNRTEEQDTVMNCEVAGIHILEENMDHEQISVIFPGGITLKNTEEEVQEIYGEADSIVESLETFGRRYRWVTDTSQCSITFDPEDGKMVRMELCNYRTIN
ncbi:MAG: hypothetical protein KH828_12455 [Clostridiales bacterium]|nr:hypothetical protein [Clostridiales bacterium]